MYQVYFNMSGMFKYISCLRQYTSGIYEIYFNIHIKFASMRNISNFWSHWKTFRTKIVPSVTVNFNVNFMWDPDPNMVIDLPQNLQIWLSLLFSKTVAKWCFSFRLGCPSLFSFCCINVAVSCENHCFAETGIIWHKIPSLPAQKLTNFPLRDHQI